VRAVGITRLVICAEAMMRGQAGFWDIDERYVRLSEAGDPLEKLNALVPWDVFRKPLTKALKRSDGASGGRPPYGPVMMFRIMVLQALYSLSDDQVEFQIQDRLSFMRFLGLGFGDKVPDAKTIWLSASISPRPALWTICSPASTGT
jgi:transposase, IS5 family